MGSLSESQCTQLGIYTSNGGNTLLTYTASDTVWYLLYMGDYTQVGYEHIKPAKQGLKVFFFIFYIIENNYSNTANKTHATRHKLLHL